MRENIESFLLEQYEELYLSIKKKAVEELNLPIKVGNTIIGFGKILDFYMFWIGDKRGTVYFNARKSFSRPRKYNSIKIELIPANKNAIFSAIDNIYNSYLESNNNGNFEAEEQRVARKIDTNRKKRKRREAVARNLEESPAIELLWNDVTVAVLERAEQGCDAELCLDEEKIAQLEAYGNRLVELFDKVLVFMETGGYNVLARRIPVYREYIESDRTTLTDIAQKHSLSRERIRQLVGQVDRHIFDNFKKAMLFDDEVFNACVEQIAEVLGAVEYNIPHLLAYGLANISNRKKSAVLNMLFGKECSQNFMEKDKLLTEKRDAHNKRVKKDKAVLDEWECYNSKICYPSAFSADPFETAGVYKEEKRFDFVEKVYKKLKKLNPLIEIIENPDIVYYRTSQTEHHPNFLLRVPDGRSVLVLVLPTINMAFKYNIQRCNELHRFCKNNGYGYLIIDDRGNSIYDIRNKEIAPELVGQFNAIMETRNMIIWSDIKEIKLTRPVSNADIVAYVLQNKLYITMSPFCIRRRKSTTF
ncbi:MAG: hypothetical protein J6A83_01890 [Clostridia bacterium]|nr:hypothetical protein [Clostridia bacterium]